MIQRICKLIKMKPPYYANPGLLFASDLAANLPIDGAAGYQTGCIFQVTNGSAGSAMYVNEGSESSCLFRVIISTLSPLAIVGTSAAHALSFTSPLGMGAKNIIRIGAWGTEIAYNAGSGLIRAYGNISSGTDATVLAFIRSLTSVQADNFAVQIYADCDATTPGPKNVQATSFFSVVNDGKYLAASVAVGDGLIATWHKVTAPVGAHVNGNVSTIWLDNQINTSVGGEECTILNTTGGSVPGSWAKFNTTSGGWATLLRFDSTMVGKPPLSALKPGTSPVFEGSLLISINGVLGYVPFAVAANVS